MTPKPDYQACADRLIEEGTLFLPCHLSPRRAVRKICNLVTRSGYTVEKVVFVEGGKLFTLGGPDACPSSK